MFLVSSFRGKGRKRENRNNVDDSISSSSSSYNYKLLSGSMCQGEKMWMKPVCLQVRDTHFQFSQCTHCCTFKHTPYYKQAHSHTQICTNVQRVLIAGIVGLSSLLRNCATFLWNLRSSIDIICVQKYWEGVIGGTNQSSDTCTKPVCTFLIH